MTALVLAGAVLVFVVAYFTYGRFMERRVVGTSGQAPPSHRFRDGIDYVPTNRFILFGHHFASIAGVGPIVGPTIALVWGWVPGLLWVWVGSIFLGGVHDYFSLASSVRYDGKSIQYVAQRLLGRITGRSFAWFILFLCILVVAAFASVAATTFVETPGAGASFLLMTVAALVLGFLLYRTKIPFGISTLIGIVMLAGCVFAGTVLQVVFPFHVWIVFFFIYIVIASAIPVNLLLQPRDYLNSFLLYFGLLVGGVAALAGFRGFDIPAVSVWAPKLLGFGKGLVDTPFWPTIILVVACGSISGFHSLVASGTSSKQLGEEKDSLFIGFGTMFTEGVLATLVIVSVAGFGFLALEKNGVAAGPVRALLTEPGKWAEVYTGTFFSSLGGAAGVFINSYSVMIHKVLGFSFEVMKIFTAMWIASFAMTTLDTSNRLARYVFAEIADPLRDRFRGLHRLFTNRWIASLIPAAIGCALAWSGGYLFLWPAFSAANQLLASIALVTSAAWVYKKLSPGHFGLLIVPGAVLWITVSVALGWYMAVVVPVIYRAQAAQGIAIGAMMVIMFLLNLILLASFIRNFRKSGDAL